MTARHDRHARLCDAAAWLAHRAEQVCAWAKRAARARACGWRADAAITPDTTGPRALR